MDFFEAGVLDMGVDLRGGNAGMAQHHLDRSQIRPMIQQMGRKRMPEHVRREWFCDVSPYRPAL